MLSERIQLIKDTIEDYDAVKACIPYQITPYQPDETKSPLIRKAEGIAAMFDYIDTPHMKGSRLVGCGSYLFSPPPVYFTEKDREEIRNYPEKNCSAELMAALDERIFCLVPYLAGHLTVDQTYILNHGVNGMIRRLEERLKDQSLNKDQQDFLQAAIIEWKAGLHYAERYKEFYKELAEKEADPEIKQEYLDMSELIAKVPANPAETFVEALQSMWFMYRIIHADDSSGHSFGRFDQLVYPYYKKDIEEGRITREEARDYLYDFWLKFCTGHTIFERDGESAYELFGETGEKNYRNGLFWPTDLVCLPEKHVDDGYPMDIAGTDLEGNDLTNEISWMILEGIRELETMSIKPVVKYSKATDPKFMEACYKLLLEGRGLPSFAFDENMKEALHNEPENCYTEADLNNASNIGCIEVAIPGKSYTDAMNCFMNLPKILDITIHNGVINGHQVGLHLSEIKSFDDLKENYLKQLRYFIELYVEGQNKAVPFYNHYYVRPLTSTLMEDCIERAELIDNGGARHWSKSMECCGLADTADSMMAIKQAVFEEKRYTMNKMIQMLDDNFVNHEIERQYLMNKIPKYGNGIEEVDELAKFVADNYCRMVSEQRTFNGKVYRPGLYSFYGSVINLGRATGALPSGRKAKEIFALNIAPGHGNIEKGITAVLKSVTVFDNRQSMNACAIDVHLSPNTPIEVLDYIVKYLDENHGLLLQISVVDHESLVQAQKTPEKYQDLIVRVTGFSARFIALEKSVQDEVIQRSYWN